jgi:pyruvate/2-oxoglutarate dehydrogenase complex dihydrolipoamide dehydrogenase (E3) component
MVGLNAGEVIHEAAMAMRYRAKIHNFIDLLHVFLLRCVRLVLFRNAEASMAKTYDLVLIGTGMAAQAAASRCRSAGWRVAVIDHLPFGGTCMLRGCDPKKVLVGAAEAIDHARP